MNETNVFFSAIQSALDAHIKRMVEEATAPLIERIATQEALLRNATQIIHDRVAALENAPATAVQIDEAKMVEALNTQEWFWEKVGRVVDGKVEEAIDDHCSNYDHDTYDTVAGSWADEDPADFMRESSVEDQIEETVKEVLNNASFSISI